MTALCPKCFGQRFEAKSNRCCVTCNGDGRIALPKQDANNDDMASSRYDGKKSSR